MGGNEGSRIDCALLHCAEYLCLPCPLLMSNSLKVRITIFIFVRLKATLSLLLVSSFSWAGKPSVSKGEGGR